MKLTARIVSVAAALPVAVRDSRRRWYEREALLLKVEDGEGHVGQGEAAPLPGYSPDTIERACAALHAFSWDRVEVLGEASSPLELERALGDVDPSCPSARAAVEMALLDLVAQWRGEPLHRILRGGSGTGGAAPVALAALLPMNGGERGSRDEDAALEAALAFAAARAAEGITVLKAKIGADLERELAFLERFRARCGHACTLRLDANQSLEEAGASRVLGRLADLDPEYVEEPLPLDALFRLKEPPSVPIALDESLQESASERSAMRALDEGLVKALVLKPAALGGLSRCIRLAHLAARRGASSSVSHLYDGPVARAACAELALALERPAAAGLAPHPGLDLWPTAVSPAFRGGRIEPHDAPGLGLLPLEVPT